MKTMLSIAVSASPVEPGPGSAENPWLAKVEASNLAELDEVRGMFAWGNSFREARAALAEVVWACLDNTPFGAQVETLQMQTVTVKHFRRGVKK